MIVTAHQPVFLPYLGVVRKIIDSDCLVYLDDVQYVRRGYMNRNKILTVDGPKWLTVPVKKCPRDTPILKVPISYDVDWINTIEGTLLHVYGNAPYFDTVFDLVHGVLLQKPQWLWELNTMLLEVVLNYFALDRVIVRGSMYDTVDDPTLRIVSLVEEQKGTIYLSGANGRKYMDSAVFESRNMGLVFQDYTCLPYRQFNNEGEFVPYMSVLDYMMNMGNDISLI